MSDIRFPCNTYLNCPICGKTCEVDEVSGWKIAARVNGMCRVYNCYNPLANNPLHYYSHVVEKENPEFLIFQEFSLDLGTKSILFGINFQHQKTTIKAVRDVDALELDFIIVPDFPNLESLKKKVRTAITFA